MSQITSRWRRCLVMVCLPLAALVIGAVVAETVVRYTRPQPTTIISRGLFELDPPRRFRLTPDYRGKIANQIDFDSEVVINSHGMRGPEVGPKTGYRLLALGDSFVFGHGVKLEETFVSRVADIAAPTLAELEVLNAGVPGYGVPDAVDWLEAYGLELEPDFVLLGIYMINDLMDATEKSRSDGFSFIFPGAGPMRGALLWLYGNSHLFRMGLVNDFKGWRARLGLPDPPVIDAMREMVGSYDDSTALGIDGRRATRRALQRLVSLAAEHDFRLAAVLIPGRFQLSPPYREAVLKRLGIEPTTCAIEQAHRFFTLTLADTSIPALDLTAEFQASLDAGEALYFRADPHWSPAGHELAATLLRDFLVRQLQPPVGEVGDELLGP